MKLTIALGGNALIRSGQWGTFDQQLENARIASSQLADLIESGYELAITHGNGPQVGNLLIQNEMSKEQVAEMPLYTLVGMTQGQIGYMLQQQLNNELASRKVPKTAVSLVTQTVVEKEDPLFQNPTKPIGPFFSEAEAKERMETKNETWIEDSGRGWRKVVPSPIPTDIVEKAVIKHLFDSSQVTIASGGGGIPVVKEGNQYRGVEAVIDKDLAGAILAETVESDVFLILTDVPSVAVNFGQPDEKNLRNVTLEELKAYENEGHFGQGSMAPKVKSAIKFVERTGKKAIISSLDEVQNALDDKTGTHVTME